MTEAIEVRGLSKRFGERLAVDSLDISVHQGEFFALLGQNGAGKTTTIRMLCCLIQPTDGEAFLCGHSVLTNPAKVKQCINISPQETAVAPNLSVRENLCLIARLYGFNKTEAQAKAQALLHDLSLEERSADKARSLSGGMQRRLSIAMALISEPSILFLDEPTLGLDVRARRELWSVLRRLKGRVTVILTTHYLEEAEALSDRIAIMHEGRLCALGTANELRVQTGTTTFEDAFLALTGGENE